MSEPSVSHPDLLYSLPLERFTEARDELARQLAADGNDEEASSVGRMRKPSVAAWALNVAVRRHPDVVDRLIASHRRLREATSADLLRQASQERQAAVAELTTAAMAELSSAGRAASATTRDRVTNTLLAVATDHEAEEAFAAGRLVKEVEPSGGGWGDIGLAPPSAKDPKSREKAAAEQARARAEKLKAEAERATTRVEQAERALEDARRRAEEALAAADAAETEAKDAEKAAG